MPIFLFASCISALAWRVPTLEEADQRPGGVSFIPLIPCTQEVIVLFVLTLKCGYSEDDRNLLSGALAASASAGKVENWDNLEGLHFHVWVQADSAPEAEAYLRREIASSWGRFAEYHVESIEVEPTPL